MLLSWLRAEQLGSAPTRKHQMHLENQLPRQAMHSGALRICTPNKRLGQKAAGAAGPGSAS